MSDIYGAQQPAQAPAEQQAAPEPRPAKYWHDQLKDYHEKIDDSWSKQRENLDRLYSRHERAEAADREYSIFWANIEVLKASVYAKTPVPVVAPRFKQPNPVASAASDTLERTLVTTFDQGDIDGCLREIRDEFLRYARGTARVRLDQTRKGVECVSFDHVTAADFAHDPGARSWREVKWVGFRAWLNSDELKKRFGDVMAHMGLDVAQIPLKKRDENAAAKQKEDQAPVWEIWCKETGLVHFVNEDFDSELDTQQPWLDLSSFWPCPRPAYGTLIPGKLRPVPDILQYKDQIEEVNEYTARIAALSQGLKIKGFYLAGAGDLSDAIEAALKSVDNRATLVPVNSAAALGGGGIKDAIVWLPVTDILEIIKGLVELRRVVIDDIYQITGISDILRGQTDPNETLGAQQLKSQWGSTRIKDRQNELARFARDITRIAGEIIAENFDPQTILAMSQVQLPSAVQKMQIQNQVQQSMAQAELTGMPPQPPDPEIAKQLKMPSFEDVMAFLKDDKARGMTIEIETDSTIQPDEDAEKQRRTEFITAVGGFIAQAAPLVEKAPQLGPFVGEALKFVAQGFRAGRPLEAAIDGLVEQIDTMAQAPKPPDPEMQKVQMQMQQSQDQHQQKMQQIGAQTQATTVKANAEITKAQMGMAHDTMRHHQTMQQAAQQAVLPQPQGPVQ